MTDQTAEVRDKTRSEILIKGKIVYGYRPGKAWPAAALVLYQIAMPFFLMQTIQSIATGIAFVFYINTPEASGIRSLFASIASTSSTASTSRRAPSCATITRVRRRHS